MIQFTERGILLMNLGSPASTRVSDVRHYLNEFLMDERVIDYPWLLRLLLVRCIISPLRAPKSAHAYSTVWTDAGSPLITISRELQAALQSLIGERVELAMRYGQPGPAEAFDRLQSRMPGLKEVILIPLYPHYAMSSYETAVEYAKNIHKKNKYRFDLNVIPPYYSHPDYLEALSEHIKPFLNQDYDQILFSYHGIPERHLKKADPTGMHCGKIPGCCNQPSAAHATCYRHQCLVTTRSIVQRLAIPYHKYAFSFQSRLGTEQWLKPYTDLRLTELPGEGINKLLIVCPAFVSDCLETLEEIAIRGRESFLQSGGKSFTMIPCLNVDPLWVQTLAKWVA